MIDIIESYSNFCKNKNISFSLDSKILSYDDTTLFCPAGMQQFKDKFKDKNIINTTQSNIQSCLRLIDIDNIGDGTHFLYFNMIGLFSFRGMTIQDTINFWLEYLESINIKPDYVTIHPDKLEWKNFYNIEVKLDKECLWSDGELSGYCTEFYKNDIEIGNIVNICGDCIDVGFGLERLDMLVNGIKSKSDIEILQLTIQKIIDDGVIPSNKQHGYILRKLIRDLNKKGGSIDSIHFISEQERQEKIMQKYLRIKDKNTDKSKEWWFDTHGIDIDLV